MIKWGGRRVRALVDLVLATKGRTCHLCDLGGADSADHDPPRSVLLASGVADPDQLEYLFPSHRYPCNLSRQARPITQALRVELRAKRLRHLGLTEPPAASPRFERRRPNLLRARTPREGSPSASIPGRPGENRESPVVYTTKGVAR